MEASISHLKSVITGGTRGIGRAIAERLLREGASVALCGRDAAQAEQAARELSAAGRCHGFGADVARNEEARSFIEKSAQALGGIDVLVNNAGLGIFHPVAELSTEDWDRMIALNLSGVFYCCHAAIPYMRGRGGYIFNISSLAGKNPFAGGAGYNASKFGLNGFSEAMMLDHRNDRIRVTTIMPGSVDTDFGAVPGQKPRSDWKIAPSDIADVLASLLNLPERTLVSRVEMRPSRPPQ